MADKRRVEVVDVIEKGLRERYGLSEPDRNVQRLSPNSVLVRVPAEGGMGAARYFEVTLREPQ